MVLECRCDRQDEKPFRVLGITARGAWVCVRRHFKEMGLDPADSEDVERYRYDISPSNGQDLSFGVSVSDPVLGSRFKVVCEAPVGKLPLEYEIVEYQPPEKVVLIGRGRFFEVEDE